MPKLALLLALLLTSCGSYDFYHKVDGHGKIIGNPTVDWVKPNQFLYYQSKNRKFAFRRCNGELIVPQSLKTDGGSIPSFLWAREGYSPWTYAPAYLIHDWLYEAHRRGLPGGIARDGTPLYYDKLKSDWIMAEVIKSQMEDEETFGKSKSPGRLKAIYWAVSRFGNSAWNAEANIVKDPLLPKFVTNNIPLLPALKTLQNEITPVPIPKKLAGSPVKPSP